MKKTFRLSTYFAVILLLAVSCKSTQLVTSTATQGQQYQVYPVGFYNLENLYHPLSTDSLRDKSFSPEGANAWTMDKYNKKQKNMAYAMNEMAKEFGGLAVVGVAEIGNRKVLEDLVDTPPYKNRGMKIVHYDSPDWRGVDVGLLYDSARFHYVTSSSHAFPYEEGIRLGVTSENFRTRDVLLVEGKMADEKIAIMVANWPSRYGDKSSVSRELATSVMRHIYDSLMLDDPNNYVVIMGDLNDDPVDKSCSVVLDAKKYVHDVEPGGLFNTMWEKYSKGIGSLNYQGKWNLFDQIIVSQTLLGNDYSSLKFYKAEVFNRDFLIQKTGKYKGYPFRTFSGGHFQNGYSDHFPTYIYLVKNKKSTGK